MPNHVTNRLELIGEPKEAKNILESLKTKEEDFDFEQIIPMPKELVNTDTSGAGNSLYKLLFGYDNWYNWRIAVWGTKWNSYDVYEVDDTTIEFNTAWSTPWPVIYALAKKYPEMKFVLTYADEDLGSNCGVLTYEGAKEPYWEDKSIGGGATQEEAIRFAMTVKYGSDEDYEMYVSEQDEDEE